MKTQDLFNKYDDLKSGKADLKNRKQSIETAEHNLKGLYKEHFLNYITPVVNSLIEKGDFERVNEIFGLLYKYPVQIPEIQLKSHIPKSGMPGKPKKPGFIEDKKFFDEVLKFGKSFLSKESFERITSGIEWSSKEKVVTGSKSEFIILLNDFDKSNNEPCRTLTTNQLWQVNNLFKGKFWVDSGFYVNGNNINSKEAIHFIQQFEKIGWAKNGVLEAPVKIDLFSLTFNKNKEGLIYLTDESIYTQTEAFQNGDYQFKDIDSFGIPMKSDSGRTHYVPEGKGFYRCCFLRVLDSNARNENLRNSNPDDRVVREFA